MSLLAIERDGLAADLAADLAGLRKQCKACWMMGILDQMRRHLPPCSRLTIESDLRLAIHDAATTTATDAAATMLRPTAMILHMRPINDLIHSTSLCLPERHVIPSRDKLADTRST